MTERFFLNASGVCRRRIKQKYRVGIVARIRLLQSGNFALSGNIA